MSGPYLMFDLQFIRCLLTQKQTLNFEAVTLQ